MTIESNIEVALFTRVTSLAVTGSPSVAWPNIPFTPVPGTTYIRVDHFPNRNTRQVMKGSGPHLRQGILQLTVVAPLNGGSSVATNLAGEIAAHFTADLALFDDDVKVRIQQAPSIAPADQTDVSWDVRVDVPYETLS